MPAPTPPTPVKRSPNAKTLWLFGLDEKRGVVGVPTQNLANWWPGVRKEFDGAAPVPQDVVVEADGQSLVALLSEPDQPPYVVKNRTGGAATLEVPWREGTAVISARHEHLIRMLSPLVATPTIDLVQASLIIRPNSGLAPSGGSGPGWELTLHL